MEIFSPSQKTAFRKALGACASCRTRIDALRAMSIPTDEYEARIKAVEESAKAALAIEERIAQQAIREASK